MPTRFILAGLQFFAGAAVFAIVIALLAPIDAVRFLGVVGLACAGIGFVVQLHALRRVDPHAFMVLRFRLHTGIRHVATFLGRAASFLREMTRAAPARSRRSAGPDSIA